MSAWPSGGAGRMYQLIQSLPQQLRDSASLTGLADVAVAGGGRPSRIVFCGMGGSAIAGDLVQPLLGASTTALTVWRDYGLPPWVGSDDLVICSSYSGGTEETLSAEMEAARRGCPRLAITSGGDLAARARRAGYAAVSLPGGLPPRASLGYGLGALLRMLERLGVLTATAVQIDDAVAALDAGDAARRHPVGPAIGAEAPPDPAGNPTCAELAQALRGRVPVLYTADRESHAVGTRWKAQINENSKLPALAVAFPELDHNDLVGWCLPADLRDRFVLLILRSRDDNERGDLRVAVTRRLLEGEFASIHEIRGGAGGPLARIFSLIQYGDYLSCHLAHQAGVDPVPVERIDRLKEALAEADISDSPDSQA